MPPRFAVVGVPPRGLVELADNSALFEQFVLDEDLKDLMARAITGEA